MFASRVWQSIQKTHFLAFPASVGIPLSLAHGPSLKPHQAESFSCCHPSGSLFQLPLPLLRTLVIALDRIIGYCFPCLDYLLSSAAGLRCGSALLGSELKPSASTITLRLVRPTLRPLRLGPHKYAHVLLPSWI